VQTLISRHTLRPSGALDFRSGLRGPCFPGFDVLFSVSKQLVLIESGVASNISGAVRTQGHGFAVIQLSAFGFPAVFMGVLAWAGLVTMGAG
jgi:hypothetical protein